MGRPRIIGDVQLFALLSEGPRTRVYKGYQPTLDRFVLLKVLTDAGHDEGLARRFEEEARLIARVQHPNVVAVHACGRDDGRLYLVAEFVEGSDLHRVLEARALPPDLAAFVTLQAARGLQAAHDRDVLHRDLKPANLLLSTDGQVKVADFGMASLWGWDEDASEIRGTPAYLAPEQILGASPAPSADLFALGATLYEMLAGRPAFTGATTDAILDAVLHHDPMAVLDLHADVPVPLRRVCAKLLEKDPAGRYTGAAAVIEDLEHARQVLGFTAEQAALAAYLEAPASYRPQAAETSMQETERSPQATPQSPPKRRRIAVLAVLGLLLLVGLGYVGIMQWSMPENTAPRTAVGNDGLETRQETVAKTPTGAVVEEGMERRETVQGALDSTVSDPPLLYSPLSRGEAPPRTENSPPGQGGTKGVVETEGSQAQRRRKADAKHPPPGRAPRALLAAREQPEERKPVSGAQEPAPGRLRVTSVPWAVVYVDGDSMGITPMTTALTLPAGTHRLALKHPRLPVYKDTVRVAAGRLVEHSVALWEQVARLEVEVTPWAEVRVDGAVQDTTPLARPLVLAPGTYTLTLRHPTLGTWERRLHLRAGEERMVSVSLLKR